MPLLVSHSLRLPSLPHEKTRPAPLTSLALVFGRRHRSVTSSVCPSISKRSSPDPSEL